MRAGIVPIVVLLSLASGAQGQVSVDMRALDKLTPGQSAPPPARRPAVTPAPAPVPTSKPVTASAPSGSAAKPASKTSGTAGTVAPVQATTVPSTVAVIPAPALPTAQPSAPPESTTIAAPAPISQPLPPPVRLLFEAGTTDLTPVDEAAIRELAHAIPTPDSSSINVLAYAAGKPDDASTARRLSLSRGMAVRSVLLANGVPSTQIYVRALGAAPSDGPADRVELIVARNGSAAR
jgi:outer membrane protein OmpA-like peptidoglycan-associated protein